MRNYIAYIKNIFPIVPSVAGLIIAGEAVKDLCGIKNNGKI